MSLLFEALDENTQDNKNDSRQDGGLSGFGQLFMDGKPLLKRKRHVFSEPTTSIFDLSLPDLSSVKRPKTSKKHSKTTPPADLLCDRSKPRKYWDISLTEDANLKIANWLRSIKTDTESEAANLLMIHGPPGAGKSVSLDVILRHFGLTPFTIDADELSQPQFFSQVFLPAILYQKLPSRSSRFNSDLSKQHAGPICLVIDGLDWIGAKEVRDFTRQLLKLGNKKVGKTPIVFTVNNAFSRPLRDLRINCHLIEFPRQSQSLLKQYLDKVSYDHDINISSNELDNIILASDGDLRGALNNLQLFDPAIAAQTGSVDQTPNAGRLALDIFNSTVKSKHAIDQVNSFSGPDLDHLVSSCFLHYIYSASMMAKPTNVADWLYLADTCSRSAFKLGSSLDNYGRYAISAFKHFYQSPRRLNYRPQLNYYEPRMANYEIINEARAKSHAFTQQMPQTEAALLLYPYIAKFAEPSTSSRDSLIDLGTAVHECGVRFVKTPKGQVASPDIFLATCFTSAEKPALREKLAGAAKELSRADAPAIQKGGKVKSLKATSAAAAAVAASTKSTNSRLHNSLVIPRTDTVVDFETKDKDIWLEYVKSDENAARRPITWSELF